MTYPTTYPGARQRLIPINHSSGGMVVPTRGLIPHVQMGTSPLFGWFSNPAAGVSSHLWLSRGGEFDQYVAFDDKAWAQAAGNPYWISCECAGKDTDDYTDIQVQRLGELFAWGIREFGWKPQVTDSPNGYGLGAHRMGGAAWGGHSCPGDIRANRRGDILAAAKAINGGAPTPPKEEDMPTAAEVVDELERRALTAMRRAENKTAKVPLDLKIGPEGGVWEILGRSYFKTGDLQTRIERIETYLAGPFSAWTSSQETTLREIRTLLAGGKAADPGITDAVLERLDRAIAALEEPRSYTVTPTGDPHA